MRRKVPLERLGGLLDIERGLTAAEATERGRLYGLKDIVEAPPRFRTGRDSPLRTDTVTAALSGFKSNSARIMVLAAVDSLVLLVQVPGVASPVHLRPLHIEDWTIAVASGALGGALALLLRLRGPGAEHGRA